MKHFIIYRLTLALYIVAIILFLGAIGLLQLYTGYEIFQFIKEIWD